ncbi:hypothetical protein COMA2_30321 [Candidatus Nitrospira nitrificans]|uniref:Uncharacterized protein n=1 Tax=Candidatus Nitrospira nitrificans TaxID=1742973 RepID=A0A0S4LLR7_9BACT|nr:hypothetical protein COMA2_30321 [Candidatus Nitrospira nitrificans]
MSNVNETSRTTEPTETTSSALTPSQVYQRKWQAEHKRWTLAMNAQGTPVNGRAVPRKSRSKLSYTIKTRYTQKGMREHYDD